MISSTSALNSQKIAENLNLQRVSEPVDTPYIVEYAAQYGLTFSELSPYELAILLAARNAEEFVKSFQLPMADLVTNQGELLIQENITEEKVEKRVYKDVEQKVDQPANRMDVGLLSCAQQLPDLIPTEWLQEELSEEQFLAKINAKTLLKREWREPKEIEEVSYETVQKKELIEVPAPPKYQPQDRYVLIDYSSSMSAWHDGRDITAAGTALAFLKLGFEQKSRLLIRPFAAEPAECEAGFSREEFHKLAKKIIKLQFIGRKTDIQAAIAKAAEDIQAGGKFKRADILLLTDGFSELSSNPLGKIRLHTILMAIPIDDRIKGAKEARQWHAKLKSWSTSWQELRPEKFGAMGAPLAQDFYQLEQMADTLPARVLRAKTLKEVERLLEQCRQLGQVADGFEKALRLKVNLRQGTQAYTRANNLQSKTRNLLHFFEAADLKEIVSNNLVRLRQEEAEYLRKILEARKLEKESSLNEMTASRASLSKLWGELKLPKIDTNAPEKPGEMQYKYQANQDMQPGMTFFGHDQGIYIDFSWIKKLVAQIKKIFLAPWQRKKLRLNEESHQSSSSN